VVNNGYSLTGCFTISLTNSVIEYAVPNESNNAHKIILGKPIDAINPLFDSANIQKDNRKMAGVSINADLTF